MKDLNSFNISIENMKKKNAYFIDRTHKSKKQCEENKTLKSKLESSNTVVNIGGTTAYLTISVTAVGMIVVPVSAGVERVSFLVEKKRG